MRTSLIMVPCLVGQGVNSTYETTPELSASELYKRAVASPYIFTAFTSASESNLFVYTSNDGTSWNLLKGPAYTPPSGLIRDPSVILHTDGRYYIAYTTNWSGQNFAIASSSDLQNWSLVATISTKAPAASTSSSPLSTGSYGPFLPYVFTANDNSLRSWSGPVVMSGISNAGLGYIDTFPVYVNNVYHIFAKAESNGKKTIEHATANSLTGPYTFAEGPSVTVLPNGQYRIYADGFSSGKYIYADSSDLWNWSAFKTIPSLSGTVRHGTVLRQ
ncbi:arabinosidase [Coprinopsis sp. MPI-PUGE-AT-0042]|nr:arabinosidase [Coprinopsis sp. MPI-PUGE-AT-0042]